MNEDVRFVTGHSVARYCVCSGLQTRDWYGNIKTLSYVRGRCEKNICHHWHWLPLGVVIAWGYREGRIAFSLPVIAVQLGTFVVTCYILPTIDGR